MIFHILVLEFLELNVDGFVIFTWEIITTSITSVLMDSFAFLPKKKLECKNFRVAYLFFYLGFLSETLTINGTAADGRRPSLFLSTIYTTHSLAVCRLMWLTSSFNCSSCKCQALTRMLISFCLLILCQILLTQFSTDKWIWTRIDYHSISKNETTN